MKKYLVSILLSSVFFSCNTKQNEKHNSTTDSTTADTGRVVIQTDTTGVNKDTHYFWNSDFDPKKGLVMTRSRPIPADSLTVQSIIQALNDMYPEINLALSNASGDSITINIGNSNYLTNQTGSSGAEAYLAEVTYNLTEIKGINFVHFNFKKGNHASPGTYSRTDFIHE